MAILEHYDTKSWFTTVNQVHDIPALLNTPG
jgi:hypothetical protein